MERWLDMLAAYCIRWYLICSSRWLVIPWGKRKEQPCMKQKHLGATIMHEHSSEPLQRTVFHPCRTDHSGSPWHVSDSVEKSGIYLCSRHVLILDPVRFSLAQLLRKNSRYDPVLVLRNRIFWIVRSLLLVKKTAVDSYMRFVDVQNWSKLIGAR